MLIIQKFTNYLGFKNHTSSLFLLLTISVYTYFRLPPCPHVDYLAMYDGVVKLQFQDNWPPLSMLIWYYLDKIKQGGDLMLIFTVMPLWAACIVGVHLFKNSKIKYWFIFIPFIPTIFLETTSVLKDTIFSFGYMFLAIFLSGKTLKNQRLSLFETILVLIGLFYCSMAKVQAQFIFPFMTLWIIWLQPKITFHKSSNVILKTFLWIGLSLSFSFGMKACLNYFVKQQNNTHYWQYVKIYDLAGISVFANKVYVPQFLFKKQLTTVADIEKAYDYLWEPLIVYPESPLKRTHNDQERAELLKAWENALFKEPLAYIKHRARGWFKMLSGSVPKGVYVELVKDSPILLKLAPIFSLLSFLPFFPFFLYFWWLSFRNIKTNQHAIPLFMLSSMGLMLIFVLFVCSLAFVARYIYFSWCCFAFSVPFAYQVFKQRKKSTPVL